MTVKELIQELSKFDSNLEVVHRDNDYWYYSASRVKLDYVDKEGRQTDGEEENDLCVAII